MADLDLGNPTDLAIVQEALALQTKLDVTHAGAGGSVHPLATNVLAGFMSAADRIKLDSVSPDANNYSHPTGDGNLHVPPTSTTNNAKFLKAGATAGSIAWAFVTKADVGLANADNTSDANKPISTATQAALDTLTTAVNSKLAATHEGTGGATHAAATTSAAGFMSAADKTKLDGVAANANNYTHPSGDGNLHVPATGTTSNNYVLKAGPTAGSISWQPITKADVGLGNVDNTSDVNKPVSTAQQTALDLKLNATHAGTGGTAHAAATTSAAGFMSAADKTKLDGIEDSANNYVHPTTDGNLHVPATGTSNDAKFLKAGATAGSIAWSFVTKADVGLSNVDNTSDANKPVSTAQQTALDGKLSKLGSDSMAGTMTAAGFIASGDYVSRGGGAGADGGQIVLGFGNNLASGISAQANYTWNIDVGGATYNTLRFYLQDGTGAIVNSFSADVGGNVTFSKNLITQGNLDIATAAPLLSFIETDNANNYFAWQHESNSFRLRYNAGVIWTITSTGAFTTTGTVRATGIFIGSGTDAVLNLEDADAGVGLKYSRLVSESGVTKYEILNDAKSVVTFTPIQFNHANGVATLSARPSWNGYTPWDSNNLPAPLSDAPSDGSTYARRNAAWVKSVGGAVMQDTAPSSPEAGQKWIRTTDMKEYVWYDDGTSSQWVEDMYADAQRPASDSNTYVMKNGVWTLAPVEPVIIKYANGTSDVYIEIDLVSSIEWYDVEYYNIRPNTGSANYVLMNFYAGGAWYASNGNYAWTDHYVNSGNHNYWHEGSAGAFSTAMALSSGAIGSASSTAWGYMKVYAGSTTSIPQAIWTSRFDTTRTDGSGYLGVNIRATKFRIGLTGTTPLAADAHVRVRGVR